MKSSQTYQESPNEQFPHYGGYPTNSNTQFEPVRGYQQVFHDEPAPLYPGYGDQFRSPQQRHNNFQSLEGDHLHGQTMLYGQRPANPGVLSPQHQYHRGSSPQYSQASSTETSIDEALLSEALAFTQHSGPVPSQTTKLLTPIAIPQNSAGMGQPFLRAWAPVLQNYNISMPDFVAFIDNLNVISTASPPLQVVDLAGGIIGMVPHHWAAIAGAAIQGTAKLGTYAVSKGRTEAYMSEVNKKMFGPRGLKVSIVSTDATRALLKIPRTQPRLAPLTSQTMHMSTAERVLVEMQPYNAVLDLNVPPPAEQTTTLAKLSARQVASRSKKQQESLVKSREKALGKQQEKMEKSQEKEGKQARKREKKEAKRTKKREKKHGKESSDSDSDSEDEPRRNSKQKEHREKRDKEAKQAEKLLWIVIDNL